MLHIHPEGKRRTDIVAEPGVSSQTLSAHCLAKARVWSQVPDLFVNLSWLQQSGIFRVCPI